MAAVLYSAAMTVISRPGGRAPWSRLARLDLAFGLAVAIGYLAATTLVIALGGSGTDRMMLVAERVLGGHLDVPALKGMVDTATFDGRTYVALGPMQLLPYLPFAAVSALHGIGRYVACLGFGIPAAWLSLPLARAYGARGSAAYWIAIFTAFGSLLWYVSVFGDMYYLAHAESFLALTVFLLEWAGKRRPAVLGVALAISLLARPTTVLAAAPFGLALLWQQRSSLAAVARSALAFGLPIGAAIVVYGWFNWLRFGSPLESGYGISVLNQPSLEVRRAIGIFSIRQVPENIRLAFLALPGMQGRFPFLVPSTFGMTMALVSPALITTLWAGFRDRSAQLMWIAAALVAVPVFLYYGGGYVQYGFRYSLDFTPFLVALMAIGSRRWIGRPEQFLILAGIASVAFGIVWHAR
jgi:hypothetical protein